MVVIKIQNKTDIRRITVDIVPKYEELLSLARNLFGSSLPSQFVLKYTDEDADKITVSSDRELEEAFKVMNKLARFEVVATKTARPPMNKNDRTVELDIDIGSNLGETVQNLVKAFMKVEGEQPTAAGVNNNNNEAVHYGVTCDGCGVYPIRGLRLKCSTCPDYDLCEKCHKQNIHSEHKLTSIPPRHHAWNPRRSSGGCPYFKSRCAAPTTTTATTTVPEPKQEVNPESAPIEVKSVEVKEPVEEVKPVVEVKPVEVKTEVKPVEVKPVEEVKPVAEVKEQVPEPVHPFADKLKQLEDMGFSDKTKNIELLLKNKGDLVRAVTQLLNSN